MDYSDSINSISTNSMRKSVSTLNLSLTNQKFKLKESHSYTNGENPKRIKETRSGDLFEDENVIRDSAVFHIWTKQHDASDPYLVFEDTLMHQGRRHSASDIAPVWKKDCRMWLWKNRNKLGAKKDKIIKKAKDKTTSILSNAISKLTISDKFSLNLDIK